MMIAGPEFPPAPLFAPHRYEGVRDALHKDASQNELRQNCGKPLPKRRQMV